jgi:hypothetical protein
MMKIAGLVAAILAAWQFWNHEWLAGTAWVVAAATLVFAGYWWASARSGWRG